MQQILHNQTDPDPKKQLPIIPILGFLVLVAIAPVLWIALRVPEAVKMSPEEQAYGKSIRIENIALSRAENFLHQEVTILDADAVNAGHRSVAGLALTVEFFDDMHQVVLPETRDVLGTPPAVFAPGQNRSFSLSFQPTPHHLHHHP